jgi:hypothetical protein
VGETSPEGWWSIGDSKFGGLAIGACCDFGYEQALLLGFPIVFRHGRSIRVGLLVFGRMRIGPFDLNEAFGAYGLFAAPGCVQVRRVV